MIQWYAQEHPASCVAACLRMVLSDFGAQASEPSIRQLLGNPRYGLTLEQAADKLTAGRALVEYHADWGLDDLRDCLRIGAYPIVGVERRYFDHASAAHAVVVVAERRYFDHASAAHAVVVVAERATEIEMLDPLIGPDPHVTMIDTFAVAWRTAGQEVLILTAPFEGVA